MQRVEAVVEKLSLPTYRQPEAEAMPMFAENRVHQRSSGNPYPNRVVSVVNRDQPQEKAYVAIRLENDYLRLVLLPELGGRIYSAYDKVNDYDFFYKQHVIKPALIGMLGSWISGGVEFNWPCHHRPSTYMPVDYAIERETNGAVTVWMSEHEPLDRMKGMVGIRLAPGEAIFQTRMRLYNRTPVRHSFLWWENAAVPVNEQYRLFFPHDVTYVQFHYRKDVTTYPLASGVYNGIDMGQNSVDIRMHQNTRQPTSYFCGQTKEDFFGGYDEGRQCGVVHVADRYTSIGKKMFTWAYHQLSQSWENALTDTDGAYAELMAGSYSANQPDFAWLEPYETKKFTQSWYPIGAMGTPDCATYDAAIHLEEKGVRLQTTRAQTDAVLICDGRKYTVSAQPCQPVFVSCGPVHEVTLLDAQGHILLRYTVQSPNADDMPDRLPALPALNELHSAQDCYYCGVHVDQYRDPIIRPDSYFARALELDDQHVPTLLAMARYQYQSGNMEAALSYAYRCRSCATRWNFHMESGETEYLIGLILQEQGHMDDAYAHFQKAHWNQDRRAAAMTRIAMIDGLRRHYAAMREHAAAALEQNTDHGLAVALAAIAEYHLDMREQAVSRLDAWLACDPVDYLAAYIKSRIDGSDASALFKWIHSDSAQACLDLAFDLMDMGETVWAADLLGCLPAPTAMTAYTRATALNMDAAALEEGSALAYGAAFPYRQAEERVLRNVLAARPDDAVALFGLGCLLYGKRRYGEAAECWEKAIAAAPECYMSYRCLAIARFSHLGARKDALPLLHQALALKPKDPQLVWETAYVMNRLALPAGKQIAFLKANTSEQMRDDLALQLALAYQLNGEHEQALALMSSRSFVPCEGGEHAVADQYMFAHYAIGRKQMAAGQWEAALTSFRSAQELPPNLGAGLWHEVKLVPHQFYEAVCLEHLNRLEEARSILMHICTLKKDFFSDMHLQELPCYQGMAHIHLGHDAYGREMLIRHLQAYRHAEGAVDPGFYSSTPFFISYTEDANLMRRRNCAYQQAFALTCLGQKKEARAILSQTPCDPSNLYGMLIQDS